MRRLVPSWSFLTRLRRPYLFPCAGKDRGEKGAWMRLVLSASDFRQAPSFWMSFHSEVTSRASWYAPPDTGVPNLQLVALERLPSIEGAGEILIDVTFLRGSLQGRGSAPPETFPIFERYQLSREKSRKTEAVFLVGSRESEGKSKSPQALFLLPAFSFGEAKENADGQLQICTVYQPFERLLETPGASPMRGSCQPEAD